MIVGLSLGHRTVREAEHWLAEHVPPLDLPDLVACTHLSWAPHPHVALSLGSTCPTTGWPGCRRAPPS
ncbi:hypothetical protein [Micromonospora sp. NPDC048842]|uniref:hypothetical protein n=1 Tax=unclassified Micromonospora TaxID=2617518 RepID=UPI00340C5F8E